MNIVRELLNSKRARLLKKGISGNGPVLYWMSRDQRVQDNWALIFADAYAKSVNKPVMVVFTLTDTFLNASLRQYDFLLKGLEEVENELRKLNIALYILHGEPDINLVEFVSVTKPSVLITDFDPLNIKKAWKSKSCKKINIPVYEVDAHNIVPCWVASDKEEYSAGTFRPKITRYLNEYLFDFPELVPMSQMSDYKQIDWKNIRSGLRIDKNIQPIRWITPGEHAAIKVMHHFIENKIFHYSNDRNDPNRDVSSNLSPYIHFGQISAQRIALEVLKENYPKEIAGEFLEQLIVRRELADNFCHYNPAYDSFKGFKPWATMTLNNHRTDQRSYIYKLIEFDKAKTHDELWNAAQLELMIKGKMHGYMRMYWAKKILEWTTSPEEAFKISIYLNDKYSIDGRDPNGYTGCAWSVGGIHDRAWGERPVFGKLRYMNLNGCRRKFDVDKYISTVCQIANN